MKLNDINSVKYNKSLCETTVCHVAQMFYFAAWHQMASSAFHVMAFGCHESLVKGHNMECTRSKDVYRIKSIALYWYHKTDTDIVSKWPINDTLW